MYTRIAARTRQFVIDNFLYTRPGFILGDEDHLIEDAGVDSMGMTEVVAFVEDEWGIEVPDEDITEANFTTIAGVTRYLLGRGAGLENAAA